MPSIAAIYRPSPVPRSEDGLVRAMQLDPRFVLVEYDLVEGRLTFDLERVHQAEVLVTFIAGRDLAAAATVDWCGFAGRKVAFDHDLIWDYQQFFLAQDAPRNVRSAIRRHGFDGVVTSSPWVEEQLRAEGFDAVTIAKAADTEVFADRGERRGGIGTFGTAYPARMALQRALRKARVEISVPDRVPYLRLPDLLNTWAGCIVCNQGARSRFGPLGRIAHRISPGAGVVVQAGHEVMIKNFEAAAAGCAVFMDRVEGLTEAGFVDGATALIYETAVDLCDRLHGVGEAELRDIGARAAALCASRHDWSHRVEELATWLAR